MRIEVRLEILARHMQAQHPPDMRGLDDVLDEARARGLDTGRPFVCTIDEAARVLIAEQEPLIPEPAA